MKKEDKPAPKINSDIFKLRLHLLDLAFISLGLSFLPYTRRKYFARAQRHIYDMLIVPGIPYDGKQWNFIMKGRVYWAKYLFDKGMVKNIMFSGSAVHTPWFEGKIMALYAKAIGIPETNIFTEDDAEHSTENIFFSYKKAREMGFAKIAFASDPIQSKALRRFIKQKVSAEIALIPMVYQYLRKMDMEMCDPFINAESAFVQNFTPLKEREKFYKRWNGTLGKNISNRANKKD